MAPSFYKEASLLFLLHIHPFLLIFWERSGSWSQYCWPYLRGFPVYWTVLVLGFPVFQDFNHHCLPRLKEVSLQMNVTQGRWGTATCWAHGSLPSLLITFLGGGSQDFHEASALGGSPYLSNADWTYAFETNKIIISINNHSSHYSIHGCPWVVKHSHS